jgi:hypothetical protein
MAEPRCPNCSVAGVEHIGTKHSTQASKGGDAWFEVAYCDRCGHVYGVFPKHVLSHNLPFIPKRGR